MTYRLTLPKAARVALPSVTLPIVFVALAALGAAPLSAVDFLRGDANGDGVVSLADSHRIRLFLEGDAEAPDCLNAADVDDNGRVEDDDSDDLRDDIARFGSALNLKRPFPDVGPDPTANEDPLVGCDAYGGGAALDDSIAQVVLLDAVAAGGEDRKAKVTIAVLASTPLAGYRGTMRMAEGVLESVDDTPENLSGGSARRAAYADGSALHFLALRTYRTTNWLMPADGGPALELELCLAPGTPAGSYDLSLEVGELVDAATGRRIDPQLISGTLTVLEDVGEEAMCGAPPPGQDPSMQPINVEFRLEDVAVAPGATARVPFIIRSDGGIQAYAFSADFDEEILQVRSVETVWERPDGQPYGFLVMEWDNANDTPGSGGIDEGVVVGASIFNLQSDMRLPANVDVIAAEIEFETVDPEPEDLTTTVAFVDGARVSGQPVTNSVTWNGLTVWPGLAQSFVMVDCTLSVQVLPDVVVFVRGDTNGDGKVEISDPSMTLAHLFLGESAPACMDAADANDDGRVDVADASRVLNYLFLGGPPPAAPFPESGADSTSDDPYTCYAESSQ